MKIVDKIKQIHNFVKTPAGAGKGAQMQIDAGEAIRNGINSPQWKKYMCHLASNPDQLRRLIGQDTAYMETVWGPHSLAYLVANSTCGTGTTADTTANMPDPMKEELDRNLNSADAPIPDCPGQLTPENFEKYI